MPAVGKRIRDIERALRKATASGDALKETALKETLQKLHEEKKLNIIKGKEKVNSQKYHMVRFVERQKVWALSLLSIEYMLDSSHPFPSSLYDSTLKLCRRIHQIETKLRTDSLKKEDKAALMKQRAILEDDLTYVVYFPIVSTPLLDHILLFVDTEWTITC